MHLVLDTCLGDLLLQGITPDTVTNPQKHRPGFALKDVGHRLQSTRCPLACRNIATVPMTGPLMPNSLRTAVPETAGWNCAVSTPAGIATIFSASTPAATSTSRMASPLD